LVAELLAHCLNDITAADIHIFSLARTVDQWERPPTQVATLTFRKTPALVASAYADREWSLHVAGSLIPLILDTGFAGMTPLNDIPDPYHNYEYVTETD
jgi:hypothetical protein